MPWSGSAGSKTFSRTDGTRTGASTWQDAEGAGVDIVSDDHDTHDQDMATGIDTCLTKDGGNSATANISMGGFKLTSHNTAVTDGSDVISFAQASKQAAAYIAGAGAADAYTATPSPTWQAYASGDFIRVKIGTGHTNTGAATLNVSGLGVKNIKTRDGASDPAAGDITADEVHDFLYDGTNFRHVSKASPGVLLQRVKAGSAAYTSTTTVFPDDDTIPQNTEGAELFTVAITPASTSNVLRITVLVINANSSAGRNGIGLFQDTTASALAATSQGHSSGGVEQSTMLIHEMTAGTTSSTTFKVRAGPGSGTAYFNGNNVARKYGGVMESVIIVEEFSA